MGGGDNWIQQDAMDYYYDMEQMQQVAPILQQHIEVEDDLGSEILQVAIDYGAAWWIIGFAFVGAIVIFKKRIRKWLLFILKD